MSVDFQQLRTEVDLVQLIGQSLSLQQRGTRWWGRCPFHEDHHPSLSVNPGRRQWRCWVCNLGRDAIDWVRLTQNCSAIEAVRWLSLQTHPMPSKLLLPEPDPLASRATRSRAFRALLRAAGLNTAHREALLARGLSATAIVQAEYASLSARSREPLVDAMLAAVPDLRGIPGIARSVRGSGWRLMGSPGLLIPVRDRRGWIQACQIRLDTGPSRYQWLTSTPYNTRWTGCSPGTPFHVAGQRYITDQATWWITEGPLKADVVASILHPPVLGLPGVSVWPKLVQAFTRWHPRRVVLGFDQDPSPTVRDRVQTAQDTLAQQLHAAGLAVHLAHWPDGPKGMDDALHAGLAITVSRWPAFRAIPVATPESKFPSS